MPFALFKAQPTPQSKCVLLWFLLTVLTTRYFDFSPVDSAVKTCWSIIFFAKPQPHHWHLPRRNGYFMSKIISKPPYYMDYGYKSLETRTRPSHQSLNSGNKLSPSNMAFVNECLPNPNSGASTQMGTGTSVIFTDSKVFAAVPHQHLLLKL